jgi:hypothetical protein
LTQDALTLLGSSAIVQFVMTGATPGLYAYRETFQP